MHALLNLTAANIRSFVRDRAALFWTLAFPIVFVVLFGTIFGGSGNASFKIGWVDLDGTGPSRQLQRVFSATQVLTIQPGSQDDELDAMRRGDVDAVIVVPAGFGAVADTALANGANGGVPSSTALTLYTDPSRSTNAQTISQIVESVTMAENQALSGRPAVLTVQPQSLQTETLNGVSYFVPSILAMALMQLGVFASIPLVQQREKLILKRLNATPLPRWTLVGSNILMRLLIAALQTVLILGIGIGLLNVQITGNLVLMGVFVAIGAVTFISLGYVIASFARTEEAANGMTSIVQFPLMFLSGIFFPIELMPQWLKGVATFMPLTYLGDALRQTMVGGSAFAPLPLDMAVLGGWLLVCLGISARYFRWQ
jgi:ABC-2 type transport system permease protein